MTILEMPNKINKMICNCGCEEVSFEIAGGDTEDNAWGSVCINKDGEVTFSYTPEIKTLVDVESIAKDAIIDHIIIICDSCEDETSGTIEFDDGTIMEDEWEAFKRAFPHLPVTDEE
jgi:hypothetical protein